MHAINFVKLLCEPIFEGLLTDDFLDTSEKRTVFVGKLFMRFFKHITRQRNAIRMY